MKDIGYWILDTGYWNWYYNIHHDHSPLTTMLVPTLSQNHSLNN